MSANLADIPTQLRLFQTIIIGMDIALFNIKKGIVSLLSDAEMRQVVIFRRQVPFKADTSVVRQQL